MRLDMGSSFIVSRAVLCLPRTLSKMERCEEKIRYRTAAGASWAGLSGCAQALARSAAGGASAKRFRS